MELCLNLVALPFHDKDPNILIHTDQYTAIYAGRCLEICRNIPFCPYAAQYGNLRVGDAWRMYAVENRVIHTSVLYSMHTASCSMHIVINCRSLHFNTLQCSRELCDSPMHTANCSMHTSNCSIHIVIHCKSLQFNTLQCRRGLCDSHQFAQCTLQTAQNAHCVAIHCTAQCTLQILFFLAL